MKTLIYSFVMSIGMMASVSAAQQTVTIEGKEYTLATLMENCQKMTDDPVAQIDCFGDVARLLEEQSGQAKEPSVSVPQALDSLRTLAQYQDADSGLSISGTDCAIQILYFNNYFHISRRNISSIDVFSAQFDASHLKIDTIGEMQGGHAPLAQASLDTGAIAIMRGGVALDSSQHDFSPRSPGMSIDAYADAVAAQLPTKQANRVEFVLIHPQQRHARSEIWNAFATLVKACKA